MNAHHAVVNLALIPVPLTLDARRVNALLGRSRLIHQTNGIWVTVVTNHDLLNPIDHPLLIPMRRAQKNLQGTGNNPGPKGDRLSTLAL